MVLKIIRNVFIYLFIYISNDERGKLAPYFIPIPLPKGKDFTYYYVGSVQSVYMFCDATQRSP
jgi:hypothetical protein